MKNIKVNIRAETKELLKGDLAALRELIKVMPIIDKIYKMQISGPGKSYPKDLNKKEFGSYLKRNPKEKNLLESHFAIIKRQKNKLVAIPYSEVFAGELKKVSDILISASKKVTHLELKKFLELKAKSFKTNDYATSDIAWLKLEKNPIELTVGPYEEYDDKLWGVKRSFEAVLGVSLQSENRKLENYQKWANQYDKELGKKYKYKSNGTNRTMSIVDEVFAGGFARAGFVPMAYNLPNDTWIRQKHGSKQVFMRNVIYAKFENITKKIAKQVVSKKIETKFGAEDYTLSIIGHELSHGLGVYCKNGLREFGHTLEEAKADVYGTLFLYWLADKGHISAALAYAAALSKVVDGLRQVRFGQEEAHAQGAVIQYRWLLQSGGIEIINGRIIPDEKKLRLGQESLGEKFAEIAFSEDYDKAKKFVNTWGKKIPELDPLIEKLHDIPVDIKPVFQKWNR